MAQNRELKITDKNDNVFYAHNFHMNFTEPRKPEHLAILLPLHSLSAGEFIEVHTADIKSVEPSSASFEIISEANKTYLANTKENFSVEGGNFVEVGDLRDDGTYYRINLPRREPEEVFIRNFFRDRRLVEIENVHSGHRESFITDLTTWEEIVV